MLPDRICSQTPSGLILRSPHGSRASDGEIDYDTLHGLVTRGDGWKELHFIVRNSDMLAFAEIGMFDKDFFYWRNPPETTLDEAMFQRDGAESGSSVAVYRSTLSNTPGSATNPLTRHVLELKVYPPEELKTLFDWEEGVEWEEKGEDQKELLVVVKRGENVNFMEHDEPPYAGNDIRSRLQGINLAEIIAQSIDFPEATQEDYAMLRSEEDLPEANSYDHIDE